MSNNTFTIQDIRDAADRKYKGLRVDLGDGRVVEFRNILRLDDAARARFEEAQNAFDADREDIGAGDMINVIKSNLLVVADNEAMAQQVFDMLGNDLVLFYELMESWKEQTQLGEAESSKS